MTFTVTPFIFLYAYAFVSLLQPETASAFLPYKTKTTKNHVVRPRVLCDETSPVRLFMSIPDPLDTLTSGLASIARLPNGVTVAANIKSDSNIGLLKLYDIENSRPCRSVREQITELDLVVDQIIPAAPNSRADLPPGATVPCLVVSLQNSEESVLSGEDNILSFLEENFRSQKTSGDEDPTTSDQIVEVLNTVGSYVSGYLRPGRGDAVSPAVDSNKRPEKPLILYSYEGNQFCRLVREVLTELDITYELRSAGKESPRREELAEITGGSTQCPYIIDPNTGVSMAESADIIQYLYDTYAFYTPPNELLEWVSSSVMVLIKPIFAVLAPLQAGSNQEDSQKYKKELTAALAEIEMEALSFPVVVYTYDLSPFSSETKALLKSIDVDFKEISLGKEWIPGLLAPNAAIKRAALLEMTGQSSLPHIFVGGKPIGGLFNGNPGLLPSLREGKFLQLVNDAKNMMKTEAEADAVS